MLGLIVLMMHEVLILLFLNQSEERVISLQFSRSARLKAYFLRLLLCGMRLLLIEIAEVVNEIRWVRLRMRDLSWLGGDLSKRRPTVGLVVKRGSLGEGIFPVRPSA